MPDLAAAARALLLWCDDMARFFDSVRPGGPVLGSDPDIDGFRVAVTALRSALRAHESGPPSVVQREPRVSREVSGSTPDSGGPSPTPPACPSCGLSDPECHPCDASGTAYPCPDDFHRPLGAVRCEAAGCQTRGLTRKRTWRCVPHMDAPIPPPAPAPREEPVALHPKLLTFINGEPALLSFLYDAGLLPEQLFGDARKVRECGLAVAAFAAAKSATPPSPGGTVGVEAFAEIFRRGWALAIAENADLLRPGVKVRLATDDIVKEQMRVLARLGVAAREG